MKAALFGVGHWGRNHLKVYSDLKKEEIIENLVIFDTNTSLSKKLAKDFGVEFTKTPNDILQNQQIQMVSIATPTQTHFSLTKRCLKAGKDVLVEKPMAMNSSDAWELIRLSNDLNRILLVGHIFRFHNALIELKRIMNRGDLGHIIEFKIDRSAFAVPRKDIGVLHALGIHDVDIPCFLLDQEYPKEIGAFAQSYYRDYPDEIALIFQKFHNGTISVSYESWLNPIDGKIRNLLAIGTRGSIKINFLVPDTLTIIDSYIDNQNSDDFYVRNEGIQTKRVDTVEPLRNEIYHFVDSSINETSTNVPPEIGARALEMIEMAYESIKSKRMINLDGYNKKCIK